MAKSQADDGDGGGMHFFLVFLDRWGRNGPTNMEGFGAIFMGKIDKMGTSGS